MFKNSILSYGDFCDSEYIVALAPGQRVEPASTKNLFEYSESTGHKLSKTFDRFEIDSFFAENGALE